MKSEVSPVIEWALRLIASLRTLRLLRDRDNLLRLPVEASAGGIGAPGCLLSVLDALAIDERVKEEGDEARFHAARAALIQDAGLRYGQDAFLGLSALWGYLCTRGRREVIDAAMLWGWPTLWRDPSSRVLPGYCELHAHLTGSVPFDALWVELLADERAALPLCSQERRAHGWETNLAELVAAARRAAPQLSVSLAVLPVAAGTEGMPRSAQQYAEALRHVLNIAVLTPGEREVAWVYVCVASHLRLSLLQQRRKSGLVAFKAANNRSRDSQSRVYGRTAGLCRMAVQGLWTQGTVAVELRPTMGEEPAKLRAKLQGCVLGYLQALAQAAPGAPPPPTFGLVLSLRKQQDKSVRHQDKAAAWEGQVRGLLELIEGSPLLQRFVVGIDAAGAERGAPPDWLRPAFDALRDWHQRNGLSCMSVGRSWSAKTLSEWLGKLGPDRVCELLDGADPMEGLTDGERQKGLSPDGLPPAGLHRLGRTVHAGEDFDDPITGLRQLWEAVEGLDLGPGDRVGHALVLGLDERGLSDLLARRPREPDRGPDATARLQLGGPKHAVFRKPRGEHLRDLAWETQMFGRADCKQVAPDEAHARLAAASSRSFGTRDSTESLVAMAGVRDPARPPLLPALAFDDPEEVFAWDRELVVADPRWRHRFKALQVRVLVEVIRRSLVVESCPTSNMVVANLDKAPIHALLKLSEKRGLKVVLATDDPGIFGRFPADELRAHKLHNQRAKILAANLEACWVRPT